MTYTVSVGALNSTHCPRLTFLCMLYITNFVAGQSPWARAWTAAYRLYARSVCDTKSAAAAAVYGLWRYASVIFLCLCLFSFDLIRSESQCVTRTLESPVVVVLSLLSSKLHTFSADSVTLPFNDSRYVLFTITTMATLRFTRSV